MFVYIKILSWNGYTWSERFSFFRRYYGPPEVDGFLRPPFKNKTYNNDDNDNHIGREFPIENNWNIKIFLIKSQSYRYK